MKLKRLLLVIVNVALLQIGFGQQVKANDIAPAFVTKDVYGNAIDLEKYKGQKVFLAFLRYAGCPVCNLRMHELIANHADIKAAGYQLIAVFESDSATLRGYLQETEVPFTLIANPDLSLYKRYHVKNSFGKMFKSATDRKTNAAAKSGKRLFKGKKYKRDGNLTRIPADFVIDETGKVTLVHYGTTISDHLSLSTILK